MERSSCRQSFREMKGKGKLWRFRENRRQLKVIANLINVSFPKKRARNFFIRANVLFRCQIGGFRPPKKFRRLNEGLNWGLIRAGKKLADQMIIHILASYH
jgi:hypothetical protein